MDMQVESTIRETLDASNAGRIHFGQVIASLVGAGVEAYAVDYRAGRVTYYLPSGETLSIDQPEAGGGRPGFFGGWHQGRHPRCAARRGDVSGVQAAFPGGRLHRLYRLAGRKPCCLLRPPGRNPCRALSRLGRCTQEKWPVHVVMPRRRVWLALLIPEAPDAGPSPCLSGRREEG